MDIIIVIIIIILIRASSATVFFYISFIITRFISTDIELNRSIYVRLV